MLNLLSVLAVSGGLIASQPLLASESVDFAKILAGTSVVEMPAKAASLVAKADAQQGTKNVTIAVVKAAVRLNPTAAVAVVGAISRANPEMASVAAVTAAKLQNKQLAFIAKAAAEAAPSQAAAIVAALIREFPSSYALIAISASEGAPQAGKEILGVVADYVPALQASINSAVASYPSGAAQAQGNSTGQVNVVAAVASSPGLTLPVQAILVQAVSRSSGIGGSRPITVASRSAQLAEPPAIPAGGGPVLGPPFTPIPPIVTTITPSQTVPQSPGGRNYASP